MGIFQGLVRRQIHQLCELENEWNEWLRRKESTEESRAGSDQGGGDGHCPLTGLEFWENPGGGGHWVSCIQLETCWHLCTELQKRKGLFLWTSVSQSKA